MNNIPRLFGGITLASAMLTSVNPSSSYQAIAASEAAGSLALVANGEDFVRNGFISKDGWQITFDHVYLNISDAIAYATPSSFEPQKGDTKSTIEYQEKVNFLEQAQVADLASKEPANEPILVNQVEVSPGFYNALSWKLDTADAESLIPGKTMVLIGTAIKQDQVIKFNLGFNHPAEYICGEFIGDERKGIVTAETSGTVEATFHFDHIFGDRNSPLNESLNQDALGFQPIAVLAENNQVNLDDQELASQLPSQDYQKLIKAVKGLGHVGEGHCIISNQ